jgi:hypothetical protein
MTTEQQKAQQEMEMQWQTEQDQITLDYSKWSFQKRRAGLSTDHDLWKDQRSDVLSRQQAENTVIRQNYLNGLAAAKAAKQAEHDTTLDRELEPTKHRLMRRWLADHPDKNAADFDKLAWTYLRQNLVEQSEQDNREAMRNSLLKTGRYSL